LLWGSREAERFLEKIAAGSDKHLAEIAAETLFRAVDPIRACGLHGELFGRKTTRVSVKAAGSAGTTDLAPFLLGCLGDPPLARLAADALSSITGLNFAEPGMTAPAPAIETGPNEDPGDENVEMDPDESLPWPNQKAVKDWWHASAPQFQPRTRYLVGVAMTTESLKPLIRSGPQWLRSAAAEFAALRGRPWCDVSAPAFRQQERLAREAAWA
jgi:uncharacterized protein (TIGR02270 family)